MTRGIGSVPSVSLADDSILPETPSICRSSSDTHLPTYVGSVSGLESNRIKRAVSETVLTSLGGSNSQSVTHKQLFETDAGFNELIVDENGSTQLPVHSRIYPRFTMSKFSFPSVRKDDDKDRAGPGAKTTVIESEGKVKSAKGPFSGLSRMAWRAVSRSPSPSKSSKRSEATGADKISTSSLQTKSKPDEESQRMSTAVNDSSTHHLHLGKESAKGDQKRSPTKILIRSTSRATFSIADFPQNPIPRSFSSETLPTLPSSFSSSPERAPVSRSMSSERLQGIGLDAVRRKDHLWSAFKALEGDFRKFQSDKNTTKANMIRSSLLPFLRAHGEYSNLVCLRPKDLERRILILNKWWIGLLEMLNGRYGQSISGGDRSTVLDGVFGIMVRPEWRLAPLQLSIRSDLRISIRSRSTTSLESNTSEFLAESTCRNVRNIFIQNLTAQMTFVIEKMSDWNVAPSVVSFCGKTIAYAFFFVPGMAFTLVRSWKLAPDTLRRVLNESGTSQDSELRAVSAGMADIFPPALHPLIIQSLPSISRYLRNQPSAPFQYPNIRWDDTLWLSRWSGRDTDLFFVFTKFYYMLLFQFLPTGTDKKAMASAPGFILVQAQMLTCMDSIIHRSTSSSSTENISRSNSTTFDEVLAKADASASTIPLPPTSVNRSMAENRLIIFLRDLLLDVAEPKKAELMREYFAASFVDLLKAATRRTSLFNHNACFALCDLMEEAIAILMRYLRQGVKSVDLIDWPFWLTVCRRMMESQNSLTEVRVYAFLYSLWGNIASDEEVKRRLCLNWLLDKDDFQKQFNHWCPMVRAYYMRLLCWKVARLDGEVSKIDESILAALSSRLRSTWSHFLYSQKHAEEQNLLPPSTSPCNPAPGRRLMIVRQDCHPLSGGLYLPFDGSTSPPIIQPSAYAKNSSLSALNQAGPSQNGLGRSLSPGRLRWESLKNRIPFSGQANNRLKAAPETSIDPTSVTTRLGSSTTTEILETTSELHAGMQPIHSAHAPPQYRTYSFRFSLEWIGKAHSYNRERILSPPKLPSPFHSLDSERQRDSAEHHLSRPEGAAIDHYRYAGRALAEWAMVVFEFQRFLERRISEGVPSNDLVETPTLGIDFFRKPS